MPTNDRDFMDLLTEELNSCEQPKVHDTEHASMEDIIRDMHRVLAGNGGPTRGLIVKVAANNVYTKQLRDTVGEISDKLDKQVGRCDEIQRAKAEAAAVAAAEKNLLMKIASVVWDNKSFIATAAIAISLYISHLGSSNATAQPTLDHKTMEKLIAQVVESKLHNAGKSGQTNQTP